MANLDRTILAFCAQDKDALAECIENIDSKHFEDWQIGLIFDCMKGHYERYNNVLTVTLLDKHLDENGRVSGEDHVDMIETLEEAKEEIINFNELGFYIDEIKKEYTKRVWIETLEGGIDEDGNIIAGLIEVAQKDPKEAYELFQKSIGVHMETDANQGRAVTSAAHEMLDGFWEDYQQIEENPELAYGVRTGYSFIDEATLGIKPGELFLFGGRHASGKSVFLLNVAVNAYKEGKNILIISIEMPQKQYFERFLACHADLPIKEIQTARLSKEQKRTLKDIDAEIKHKWNHEQQYFLIADIPSVTALTVRAEVNQAIVKCGFSPDLIVVDYLGIMKSIDKGQADWQEQLAAAEELRELGRTENLPILSAVQLNRDGKKGKGTQRISRSDGIGATCDVFIQILEPEEKEDNPIMDLDDTLQVEIVKNRKGEGPGFQLYKNYANMVIRNKDLYKPKVQRELESMENIEVEPPTMPRDTQEDRRLREEGDFIES